MGMQDVKQPKPQACKYPHCSILYFWIQADQATVQLFGIKGKGYGCYDC